MQDCLRTGLRNCFEHKIVKRCSNLFAIFEAGPYFLIFIGSGCHCDAIICSVLLVNWFFIYSVLWIRSTEPARMCCLLLIVVDFLLQVALATFT